MILRPYQIRAIEAVREAMRVHRRVLLVAPTGSGKTHTAAELIQRSVARGKRVLFLVHRREIVQDTARRLRAAGVPCVVLMAGVQTCGDPPVVVASTATVTAREARPPADLVIQDECHHAPAPTLAAILGLYPSAHHLGLTATPERGDGVGLRDSFDHLIMSVTIRELQADGYLAPCDVLAPGSRIKGGLARTPVEAWHEFAGGRQTVAFCRSVEESKQLARDLILDDVEARHIDGTTSLAEREDSLREFAAGRVRVLTNVYVLTEGWDCPAAKVCLVARGVGHAGAYIQMVGRVLRPYRDERALIIDLGGALHEHGMIDEDREYSLDGILRAVPEKREWLSQCLSCGTVVKGVSRGSQCANCGEPWPPREAMKITGAHVGKVTQISMDEKRLEHERLTNVAAERGYKRGWIAYQYRSRFGVWPRGMKPVDTSAGE